MKHQLSKTQAAVLAKMEAETWHTAYDLQCGINTLDALARRGLVRSRHDLGSIYDPQVGIKWMLKEQ